ncbi:Boophilin-H2 [Orchesella cincta]|uniref:Boophilin-H2 n=1 Tax=Orchesella cincta TaxID=48709 RepID=A0A1D2NBW5_ORCCI|nr:Boophilin-H2 [Orchesella cincta]
MKTQTAILFLTLFWRCLVLPVVALNVDCQQPKDVGICKGAIPRFYFDTTTGNCENMLWGGCGGNSNNFETLQECQNKCK